jgi:sugar-specific transcriptional regulator TrmB
MKNFTVVNHFMDGVDPALLEQTEFDAAPVPRVSGSTVKGRQSIRSLRLEVTPEVESTKTVAAPSSVAQEIKREGLRSVEEARAVDVWIYSYDENSIYSFSFNLLPRDSLGSE